MTENILYEIMTDGVNIQVIDRPNVRHLRFGNSVRQSSINKSKPFKLQTKYSRDMISVFDHYTGVPETILVLGLGAGTIPSYLFHKFPNTKINVVELLPELKAIASEYFSMPKDERLEGIIDDAYDYVLNTTSRFYIILLDVFNKNGVPTKFSEKLFYLGLSKLLTKGGYVAFNTWISSRSHPVYIDKLKGVFDTVIEHSTITSGNHIAFCK